jgi:hypothetical protein
MEKIIQSIFNAIRKDSFGQNGFKYITNTTVVDGDFICIKCITDCVFTTLTSKIGDNGDGIALSAGDILYGPFKRITLASGSILAYNRA